MFVSILSLPSFGTYLKNTKQSFLISAHSNFFFSFKVLDYYQYYLYSAICTVPPIFTYFHFYFLQKCFFLPSSLQSFVQLSGLLFFFNCSPSFANVIHIHCLSSYFFYGVQFSLPFPISDKSLPFLISYFLSPIFFLFEELLQGCICCKYIPGGFLTGRQTCDQHGNLQLFLAPICSSCFIS